MKSGQWQTVGVIILIGVTVSLLVAIVATPKKVLARWHPKPVPTYGVEKRGNVRIITAYDGRVTAKMIWDSCRNDDDPSDIAWQTPGRASVLCNH